MTLKGGVTAVAAEIVVSPKVLPARLSQVAAAAPPALKDRADNVATVLTEAKSARRFVRSNFASIMTHSRLDLSFAQTAMHDKGLVSYPLVFQPTFPVRDVGSR
jgi:hypothetical protein